MIADFAADLKELMDANKIERANICGLSMGGYIALQFTEQFPNCVGKLILCDTRADADSNEAKDKRHAALQKIRKDGLSQFAKDFSQSVLSESTIKTNPNLQSSVEKMILGNNPESVMMTLGALASRRDSIPFLEAIDRPTLVIVGSDDRVTPPEVNESIAKKVKGAQFRIIDKAGHLSNLEQPASFNACLESFLLKDV